MALIEVKNLVKKYKISEKKNGLIGYIKFLFNPKYTEFTAVNNINWRKWRSVSLLLSKCLLGFLLLLLEVL